jgi:hypothetical protein
MIPDASLTVLATPKPFRGHVGIIQRNAIGSWTRLLPRPEIYLFGDEPGTTEIAAELHLHYLGSIARNEFGTPLLNDVLKRARELASTQLLCYVNCDIILVQEFLEAIARVQAVFPCFLAVAHRVNIDLRVHLDFAGGGEEKFRREILPHGVPGDHTAIDLFVFPLDAYLEVPPLALGRAWFDQWLIKEARRLKMPVVDITEVAPAIHQTHAYGHIEGGQKGAYWGEEALRSLAIYGGRPHAFTLLDVTHELTSAGRLRRVHFRREKHLARQWLWQNLVLRTASTRARLGLRRRSAGKTDAGAKT